MLTEETSLIERYAAAAWPAAESTEEAGWLLRHTPGVPRRRSNSALPLSGDDVAAQALPRVERFYADRGLPVTVQVSPAQKHGALDELLAARGYRPDAPTLVCTARTQAVLAASGPTSTGPVTLTERPSRAWLDAFVALDGHDSSQATADLVLARVPAPAAYVSVADDSAADDSEVTGMGLFVGAPGWAGVFCMATDPARRRQGIAAAIVRAGAEWAAAHGAQGMYLQVERDNAGARRLYERSGFTVSHSYHYRIRG